MSDMNERLAVALADRYRLERELGQGGMATVYLAADLKHDRQVAIKVLRPELAAVLGADRFVQEIKTTAALSHPHILPLFDSGEADGFLYYVMPYIEGETLREKLNRETQLGIDEAVKITTEVADALDYAHRHGVIHRDIKPENILLHDGRPMVMDFGIALAVSAAAGGRMTETGLSLGTPHYMSPEQATADKSITARSDVYSLATVLYEMLTGNPPHVGSSAQQIIMKIVTEDAAPVTQMRKSVPPNVAAALAKALEKLPADRFESAHAFCAALADPAFALGTTRVGLAGLAPPRRDRAAWTVAAIALVAVAVLGTALVRRRSSPPDGPAWLVNLKLPDSAAFQDGLALSADGSNLAYGGPGHIWLRAAAGLAAAPIPGTEGGCCPAISPDGQRVAFIRNRGVYVVPIQGGNATLLGDGFASGDDLAWTADGYIVGSSYQPGGQLGPLVRVKAAGGPVEVYTTVDTAAGESGHGSARALPDGKGVVFTIIPRDYQRSVVGLQIGVIGPEGGRHTVLLPGRVAASGDPDHLLVARADGSVAAVPFDPASRRLTGDPIPIFRVPAVSGTFGWAGYFTVARSGVVVYVGGKDVGGAELTWIDRTGKLAPADFEAIAARPEVSLSANGRIVAFSTYVTDEPSRIEIRDRTTKASSRIEVEGGRVYHPFVSGDGRTILYSLSAAGQEGIYLVHTARPAEAKQLLADPAVRGAVLSPDRRTLFFLRPTASGANLVERPTDSTQGPERLLVSEGVSMGVSTDGRWVAFVEQTVGRSQLFVRSTDPDRTGRWLVSPDAQGPVRWAPNDREVYFIRRDTLVAAQVSTTGTFAVEHTSALFAIHTSGALDFAASPDGRFLFAFEKPGGRNVGLVMLDDWRKLLRVRQP
jgi:serine/threonine protein kinase/Tol biopolymer transport system component